MPMKKRAPFFVIIAASMWGIDGIVLRPALYTLPAPLVVCLECLIVTFLLTPFFIRKFDRIKKLSGKEWLAFIGVSLFGVVIGTMVFLEIPALPLTAVLLEFIIRGNLLNAIQWLGVILLFAAIFKVTRVQKL